MWSTSAVCGANCKLQSPSQGNICLPLQLQQRSHKVTWNAASCIRHRGLFAAVVPLPPPSSSPPPFLKPRMLSLHNINNFSISSPLVQTFLRRFNSPELPLRRRRRGGSIGTTDKGSVRLHFVLQLRRSLKRGSPHPPPSQENKNENKSSAADRLCGLKLH